MTRRPEKIKSITGITSLWLEEASEFEQTDFNQLDLRLRGHTTHYKQVILTFNPVSALHWLKKLFFDEQRPSSTVIKSTYHDNRFIDETYKEVLENLKHTDLVYYNVYCLGEWGVLGNMVYTNYTVHPFSTDPLDYPSIYTGLDFGFHDPTAYVRMAIKDDELYVLEEFYESGLSNNELLERMAHIHTNRRHKITADSSEPARIKEFKKHGYSIEPAKKGPGSIKAGIDYLRSRKIHIHPNCVNFKKEIALYKYKEDSKGNPTDEPVDYMNHLMDAARYALEEVTNHRKPLKAIKSIM